MWNYRVIQSEYSGLISFEIHEVYYDENGNPKAWSKHPIAPYGEESIQELIKDIELMSQALNKPILKIVNAVDSGLESLVEISN